MNEESWPLKYDITTFEFNNGNYVVQRSDLPLEVRAVRTAAHGDIKTQMTRKKFMGLYKGEVGDVIGFFFNFYGRWARVKRIDGHISDVRFDELHLVDTHKVRRTL